MHNGEDILRCRLVAIQTSLHKAEYRMLVEKWVEMELQS